MNDSISVIYYKLYILTLSIYDQCRPKMCYDIRTTITNGCLVIQDGTVSEIFASEFFPSVVRA